jgi:hypothetical protein
MQMAYTVIVAAVAPPVAPVAVHPVGAAPGGPPWNAWITNPYVVSLTVAPPEIATVPLGQLAVAVAGTNAVVPTGSTTGAAATTWAPSDFHDTEEGARLVPETEPAASALLVTEPAASALLVTEPAASAAFVTAASAILLALTEPLASLGGVTEFAASRVESIALTAIFFSVTDLLFRVLPLIMVPASDVPPIAITSATSAIAVAVLGRGSMLGACIVRVNDRFIVSPSYRSVVSSKTTRSASARP